MYISEHEQDLKQDLCQICWKRPKLNESDFCYECANNGLVKYYDPESKSYFMDLNKQERFELLTLTLAYIVIGGLLVCFTGLIIGFITLAFAIPFINRALKRLWKWNEKRSRT